MFINYTRAVSRDIKYIKKKFNKNIPIFYTPYKVYVVGLYIISNVINQLQSSLHPAHSRVGRGNLLFRLSPFSAEFRKHCVLNEGAQRRALPRHYSKDIKI